MKSNDSIERLMTAPKIRNSGIRKEFIVDVLKSYGDVVLNILLENGHIELGNGMIIEIVPLIDRVHILRGHTYKSNRKYKLKLTMEDNIYKKIEEYYDKLKEEIL